MDIVSEALAGIRARASVVHRTVVDPPFGMHVDEQAALALVTVLAGGCDIHDAAASVRIAPGQVCLIRGSEPVSVSDPLEAATTLVVRRDGLFTPTGIRLPDPPDLATCELTEGGGTVLLSGGFTVAGQVSTRLIDMLPRFAVIELPPERLALDLLVAELDAVAPGREAALDRWLDLALVMSLRAWLARNDEQPGWYAGLNHPVVGPALRAVHADLAAPWSVESLARVASASRSTLAASFTSVVGEPPMTYLSRIRLDAATDLLADPALTVATIADRVGYASAFSFSAAFKRQFGLSPERWRRRAKGH